MRARIESRWGRGPIPHALSLAIAAAMLAAVFLAIDAITAASAHAIKVGPVDVGPDAPDDLFPVDDWIGDGFDKAKDVAFGGISIGADAIAKLITGVFGALVNLLIPHPFVDAGINAIKWLCAVPSFQGGSNPSSGAFQLNLPHIDDLREMLTWIGVAVLPLGFVYAGGRNIMAPSTYGDSPQEILGRVVFAAAWLAFYSWGWDAITQFSTLVSDGLLSIDWVRDGIGDLFTGLTIGTTIPVVAFPVLIIELLVALALLGLILMKIALLVITTFLFVIGGLIGALYPMPFGRKLLNGYLVAVVVVVALPAMWALLFTIAAALMLDASSAGGDGDFSALMAQMWVLGATFATFAIAIKFGFSAFGLASSTITSFTAGALVGGVSGGDSGQGPTQTAQKAHSLYSAGSGAVGRAGAASPSGGRPSAPGGGAEGVQRTREPAEGLRASVGSSGGTARTAATAGTAVATGGSSAAASAGGAAVKGAGGAAAKGAGGAAAGQAAPKAGLERAAAASTASRPSHPSQAPQGSTSVRSTPSGDERGVPATPPAPGSAPRESARQTPSPKRSPGESSGQKPPRGPRRSSGGKR